MQIITHHEEANLFLRDMAMALLRDGFCWKGWGGIHIISDAESGQGLDEDTQFQVAKIVRSLLPGHEGAVLCLEDGSLFVIYQQTGPVALPLLIKTLNHSTNITVPILHSNCYSLEQDGAQVIAFIEERLGAIGRELQATETDEYLLDMLVPHLGDFLDAWMTICDAREDRKTPHIMIVDDDPLTRRIISRALKDEYPLIAANNAAEAIERHLLMVPDIVFLDIGLPDADGFAVLNHIHCYDPQCMVVMFSGNSFLDNRLKALSIGASGFLSKPFNRRSFEHYIEDWQGKQPRLLAAH